MRAAEAVSVRIAATVVTVAEIAIADLARTVGLARNGRSVLSRRSMKKRSLLKAETTSMRMTILTVTKASMKVPRIMVRLRQRPMVRLRRLLRVHSVVDAVAVADGSRVRVAAVLLLRVAARLSSRCTTYKRKPRLVRGFLAFGRCA